MNDLIENPAHYTGGNVKCPHCDKSLECISIAKHFGFMLGNVIKYIWRHNLKGNAIEDLKKARKYIDFAIAELEKNRA